MINQVMAASLALGGFLASGDIDITPGIDYDGVIIDVGWRDQWDGSRPSLRPKGSGAQPARPQCKYYLPENSPVPYDGRFGDELAVEFKQRVTVMYRECPAGSGMSSGWVMIAMDQAAAAATGLALPVVTPRDLAIQARNSLRLPDPAFAMSPPLGSKSPVLVHAPTWWWLTDAQARQERAEAGPVWAEVTATPRASRWMTSEGQKTCRGNGIPWTPGASEENPPAGACTFVYEQPTDMQRTELQVIWTITWVGSGGASGSLGDIITVNDAEFPVYERQVIGVKQ